MASFSRLAFAFVVAVSCLRGPEVAWAQFATPEAAIQAVYARYKNPDEVGGGVPRRGAIAKRLLDPRLATALDRSKLDYDPFIDAQDYKISNLSIGPSQITGDRATVQVHFLNMDTNTQMSYLLKRDPAGWRIYDLGRGKDGRGLRRELGLRD